MERAEIEPTSGHPHQREFRIIVNGRPKEVFEHELSFDDVVKLAYNGHPPSGPNWAFTITYRHADSKPHDGSLTKGESVKIKDGTVFNVTATDKS